MVGCYSSLISNKTRYADKQQDAQDQPLQDLKPQKDLESLQRNLVVHSSPQLIQALVLQALEHRYNQSDFEIVDDCFVNWYPSLIPLHLEFSTNFRGSASVRHYLLFVLNEKTDNPVCSLHMVPSFMTLTFTRDFTHMSL